MKRFVRATGVAGLIVGFSALGGVTGAGATAAPLGGDHVVLVQTDNTAGNQIVAYDRAADGTLSWSATYGTGGVGGVLAGSVVDHLGSQGSLTYDWPDSLLFAVNAGSSSVSVFSVRGDRLSLRQVISSGGTFPVSVAVHGTYVDVLNAENGGSVQVFGIDDRYLFPLPASNRLLGLNPTATPQFVNTPGQVAFSPDGSKLIVTTKANGSDIDVFDVGPFGQLSQTPVVNSEPGAVPFAITFDSAGHLVIGEAGPSAVVTFSLNPDGTLTQLDSLANGQPGLCWVTPAGGYFFTGNTASNSTSGYQSSASGQLSLLGATPTDPGTVDGAASSDGAFLFVQTGGKGIVDEFGIGAGGALTALGSVTVPGGAGGEGIIAF